MAAGRKICTACSHGPCVLYYTALAQTNEDGQFVNGDIRLLGEPILFDPELICDRYPSETNEK